MMESIRIPNEKERAERDHWLRTILARMIDAQLTLIKRTSRCVRHCVLYTFGPKRRNKRGEERRGEYRGINPSSSTLQEMVQ